MYAYVIFALTAAGCALLYKSRFKYILKAGGKRIRLNDNKGILLLCMIPLFLFSAFRDQTIGADYANYVGAYMTGSWYHGIEKGFDLFLRLTKLLFHEHYTGMAVICSLIIFVSLYKYLTKNQDIEGYMYIPLLIFVLNPYLYIQSSFNIIRQGMATAFLLWFYNFFKKRKYIRSLIFFAIAVSFHKWTAVILPVIMLGKLKWNRNRLFAAELFCLVANLVFRYDFALWLFRHMGVGGFLIEGNGTSAFDMIPFAIFVFGVAAFLTWNYSHLYTNESEKTDVTLYILSLSLLLILVKNEFTYRFYIMLLFILLPAVPVIIKNISPGYRRWLTVLYPLYYFAMYLLFLLSAMNNTSYIPFRFAGQL